MSTLLRHPGAVPSLFSDREPDAVRRRPAWRGMATDGRLIAFAGLTAAMLVDVPLVRAATAAVNLVMPG